jgi:hypothetical protein
MHTSFILSNTSTDFTTINDSAVLDSAKQYEAALVYMSTYNSIPNVSGKRNNKFTYSTDNGISWKSIALDTGAYELEDINNEIKRIIKENGDDEAAVEITANISTLKSVVNIKQTSYQVDFREDQTIGSLLGFDKEVLSFGYHKSPRKVDITFISSILVNLDIIMGSYVKGRLFPTVHSFYPNVPPGYAIIEEPRPIYYPVSRHDISRMRLWLTDQNGNPIDLADERLTVRIHLRETKQSVLNTILDNLKDIKKSLLK